MLSFSFKTGNNGTLSDESFVELFSLACMSLPYESRLAARGQMSHAMVTYCSRTRTTCQVLNVTSGCTFMSQLNSIFTLITFITSIFVIDFF